MEGEREGGQREGERTDIERGKEGEGERKGDRERERERECEREREREGGGGLEMQSLSSLLQTVHGAQLRWGYFVVKCFTTAKRSHFEIYLFW